MERLELRKKDAIKALETLQEILRSEYSVIVRDASIQRFEYTFEAVWKFCKEYLKEKEGVVTTTPKMVFREIGGLGVLAEEEVVQALEMTDRRNETSHTYKEEVAKIIFESLPGYAQLMAELLQKL